MIYVLGDGTPSTKRHSCSFNERPKGKLYFKIETFSLKFLQKYEPQVGNYSISIAAAFCTGDAEILNTGALSTGYTVTLDGATDQGNGFRVTGATGSLMVNFLVLN